VATILMIFLKVLPKNFLWPYYSGPQELWGPGSWNRLNPRFLRQVLYLSVGSTNGNPPRRSAPLAFYRVPHGKM